MADPRIVSEIEAKIVEYFKEVELDEKHKEVILSFFEARPLTRQEKMKIYCKRWYQRKKGRDVIDLPKKQKK